LHKIEQELHTEIRPIPKTIDKQLYVAEYQQQDGADEHAESASEESREK
jgi:ATP-dependent RNA helicase DDX6/DHH1